MKQSEKIYIDTFNSDWQKSKKSFAAQTDYIKNSTAKYHGRVVRTLAIPKMFDESECSEFKNIAEKTHTILTKVIKNYLQNESFRKYFFFDENLQKLILAPAGYDCLLPVARVDIFFNEDTHDFKFCEINTDGTSAMNEDRELNISVKLTDAYAKLEKKYNIKSFELFDSFVKDFMAVYETYENRVSNPNVAIVDFLDRGTINEFEQFRLAFERAGINAEVCDIKELKYKDGKLFSPSNMKIDAIYRRAVTHDIIANIDLVPDFISAIENCAVCLVGAIRTQVAHSKILFKVLSQKEGLDFLTDDELDFIDKHIPKTYMLEKDNPLIDLSKICREKNKWIIKPVDSYGSYGVHAGVECETDGEWKKYINECIDKGYIVQEFVTPYVTKNTDFSEDNKYCDYSNLTGLFLYGGHFRGIYSRVSKTEIISTQYSEITLASMAVSEKDEANVLN